MIPRISQRSPSWLLILPAGWDDYSRERDDMFKATGTPWGPWYVVRSDDKKRGASEFVTHLLAHIPYEELPRQKVKLPDRRTAYGNREPG
jgi:hypothetical protein